MKELPELEPIPEGAKPSQVRPTADSVHTRNIQAIAEVQRSMRTLIVELQKEVTEANKEIRTLQQEIETIKIQQIMTKHMGSGPTA